jgi:hypothetical protein
VDVAVSEGAVLEAATGRAGLCPRDEAVGEVDAGGVDLGVLLGESTGIEARAATKLKNVGSGGWTVGGKESAGDLPGVVAE